MTDLTDMAIGLRGAPEPIADADSERPLDVRLAEAIKLDILQGRIMPNAWIREQEVAARFKVSRGPVREALRHLARAGLVEVHPFRGAQVVELSPLEVRAIFDLLESSYGTVAKFAAEMCPESSFPGLDAYLGEAERNLRAGGTLDERVAVSFGLGKLLGENCGSRTAYRMMTHVGTLALWQHHFLFLNDEVTAGRSLDVHRALVAAVKARDGATAEWAARTIVAITKRAIFGEPASSV